MPKNQEQVVDISLSDEEQEEQIETFATLYETMANNVAEVCNLARELKKELRVLERLHRRELKESRKWKRSTNTTGKKTLSGFTKPAPVPAAICKLLDLDEDIELPRTTVTKLIYGYIGEHELYNPTDKRKMNPDKALKKLFGLKKGDELSFYNIQTYIKGLYPPKEEAASKKANTKSS